MLVFAHRGYHASIPENTLAAFDAAIALGVDGIETDVRISADGIPVLFHDRLVPDGRPVASLRAAELSRAVGYDVPTLAQALSLNREIIWNLEIKTPAAQDPTIALLASVLDKERLLITAFNHAVAAAVCAQLNVDCGLLVAHRPLRVDDFGTPGNARLRTIVWNFENLDSETIRASAERGFKNFVYGVSTREEHTELAGWNLDGIITDEPIFMRCA